MTPGTSPFPTSVEPHLQAEKTRRVDIAADAGGRRLDLTLAAAIPDFSRNRLKSLIETGHVTSAGETILDPDYRVKPGQSFAIIIPEPEPSEIEPQALPLTIVFEDEALIVVNKPAGLVVHPAPGNADRTLVNALVAHCGNSLSGIGGVRRPGIVHRLDKDTSGLLVAAKTDAAHQALAAQFAAHDLTRRYQAVIHGLPQPREGKINAAIGRDPRYRKRMAVIRRGGKTAQTFYRVIRPLGPRLAVQTAKPVAPLASLVECELATGRTHQIRVHLASLGHPLVGDQVYGGRHQRRGRLLKRGEAVTAGQRLLHEFPRQALHAGVLGFTHPDGRVLYFESQLPRDIKELLESLDNL